MDLNSDLGEGFGIWPLGNDDALLERVTSANVACGFHAGDPPIMRRVCGKAMAGGVAIGAHTGYRDLAGFGRRHIDMDPGELRDEVLYQIAALSAFGPVAYVKPHGALYNAAAADPLQASAVIDAVQTWNALTRPAPHSPVPVLCQPGTVIARLANDAGLRAVGEGFADRAYRPDGRLLSRREPGAVLHNVHNVAARAVRMAVENVVIAVDGSTVAMPVSSICIHGDTPGAVAMAAAVRTALESAGVQVARFTNDDESGRTILSPSTT